MEHKRRSESIDGGYVISTPARGHAQTHSCNNAPMPPRVEKKNPQYFRNSFTKSVEIFREVSVLGLCKCQSGRYWQRPELDL